MASGSPSSNVFPNIFLPTGENCINGKKLQELVERMGERRHGRLPQSNDGPTELV